MGVSASELSARWITEKFRSTWLLVHGHSACRLRLLKQSPWRYDRFGRMIAEVGWPRAPKAFKYFHGERLNFGGRKGSKFAKIDGVRIMPIRRIRITASHAWGSFGWRRLGMEPRD